MKGDGVAGANLTMLGGAMSAGPTAYAVNGRQYVSIPAGNAVFTFTLRE